MRFTSTIIVVAVCLLGAAGTSAQTQTNTFPFTGNVGVGTTSHQTSLHLQSTVAYMPQILLESTNTSAGSGSYVILQKTKSGSSFAVGDVLGTILANGVSNAESQQAAYLTFAVDATPSSAFLPSALEFITHNSDGTSTEKLRITSKGNIGVGTSTPDALIQLAGFDSTNPIALTILNQNSARTALKLERSSGAEGGSLIWG